MQVGKSVLTVGVLALLATAAAAQSNNPGVNPRPGTPSSQTPSVLAQVRFDQQLNAQLPLATRFRDELGQHVALGDYFGDKPVVLAFVYFECPMLCTQVLNGLTTSLTVLQEQVGREFDVVAISFDPRETPALASGKKKAHVDRYKRPESAPGWHFLTGDEEAITAVTSAVGFHYVWDDKTQQFAHPSGIVVATPQGVLARYFYGIEYASRDVRFALVEASEGRIGSLVDQLLLYCYHYNPATGQYGFIAMSAVRIGGAVTLLSLGAFIVLSVRRDARGESPRGQVSRVAAGGRAS